MGSGDDDALAKVEKVLESEPYRAYEILSRLFGPIFFGVNVLIGVWRLLTVPVPENAPTVIIGKAIIFAVSTCGAFGMSVAVVLIPRSLIWPRARGLKWYDIVMSLPIFVIVMIYLWYYKSFPYLMIASFTIGFLCFFMLFILPALQKHKIVE
jgi:hypothetical protein